MRWRPSTLLSVSRASGTRQRRGERSSSSAPAFETPPGTLREPRTARAFVWMLVFAAMGVGGTVLGLGTEDDWLPLIGVAVVLVGVIAYLWVSARCPRCGGHPLIFRRSLPATCPRCDVAFGEPPRPGGAVDADGADERR